MDEMKMKQLAFAAIVLHCSFFILHQKMKKVLLFAFALLSGISMMAQGAHDFKINEVYVLNPADSSASAQYRDEFGEASSWIEIQNMRQYIDKLQALLRQKGIEVPIEYF